MIKNCDGYKQLNGNGNKAIITRAFSSSLCFVTLYMDIVLSYQGM